MNYLDIHWKSRVQPFRVRSQLFICFSVFEIIEMSERKKCSLSTCQRLSHGSCHGCQLDFCREHLFEHSLAIHLQLNPLIENVNLMNEFLKTFDRDDFRRSTYEKLEEWRKRSHQIIDIYFTKKTKNLDNFIDDKLQQYDDELVDIQFGRKPSKWSVPID